MVIVVPTFAPGQQRNQHVVGRVVAGLVVPVAMSMCKDGGEIGGSDLQAGRDEETEHDRQRIRELAKQLALTPLLDEVLNELPRLSEETDYVVADGPGSQTEMSRALLLRADFAIVPCKASMLEVRALAKATARNRPVPRTSPRRTS